MKRRRAIYQVTVFVPAHVKDSMIKNHLKNCLVSPYLDSESLIFSNLTVTVKTPGRKK